MVIEVENQFQRHQLTHKKRNMSKLLSGDVLHPCDGLKYDSASMLFFHKCELFL